MEYRENQHIQKRLVGEQLPGTPSYLDFLAKKPAGVERKEDVKTEVPFRAKDSGPQMPAFNVPKEEIEEFLDMRNSLLQDEGMWQTDNPDKIESFWNMLAAIKHYYDLMDKAKQDIRSTHRGGRHRTEHSRQTQQAQGQEKQTNKTEQAKAGEQALKEFAEKNAAFLEQMADYAYEATGGKENSAPYKSAIVGEGTPWKTTKEELREFAKKILPQKSSESQQTPSAQVTDTRQPETATVQPETVSRQSVAEQKETAQPAASETTKEAGSYFDLTGEKSTTSAKTEPQIEYKEPQDLTAAEKEDLEKLDQAQTEHQNAVKDDEEAQADLKEKQENFQLAEKDLETAKQEVVESEAKLKESEEKVKQTEEKVKQDEEELKQKEEKLTQAEIELEEAKKKLEEAEKEYTISHALTEGLSGAIGGFMGVAVTAGASYLSSKGNYEAALAELEKAQSKVEGEKSQFTEKQAAVDEAKKEMEDAQKAKEKADQDYAKKNLELDLAKQKEEENKNKVDYWTDIVDEKQNVRDDALQERDAMLDLLEYDKQANAQAEAVLAAARERFERAGINMDHAQQNYDTSKGQLSVAEVRAQRTHRIREEKKAQLDRQVERVHGRISERRNEMRRQRESTIKQAAETASNALRSIGTISIPSVEIRTPQIDSSNPTASKKRIEDNARVQARTVDIVGNIRNVASRIEALQNDTAALQDSLTRDLRAFEEEENRQVMQLEMQMSQEVANEIINQCNSSTQYMINMATYQQAHTSWLYNEYLPSLMGGMFGMRGESAAPGPEPQPPEEPQMDVGSAASSVLEQMDIKSEFEIPASTISGIYSNISQIEAEKIVMQSYVMELEGLHQTSISMDGGAGTDLRSTVSLDYELGRQQISSERIQEEAKKSESEALLMKDKEKDKDKQFGIKDSPRQGESEENRDPYHHTYADHQAESGKRSEKKNAYEDSEWV